FRSNDRNMRHDRNMRLRPKDFCTSSKFMVYCSEQNNYQELKQWHSTELPSPPWSGNCTRTLTVVGSIRLLSRNRTRLLSRQKGRTASSACCFLPAHPFR